MKFAIVIGITLAAMTAPVFAQSAQYVPGYFRADGTYVQGYYRTVPDNNPYNNYSARGNVNPYTGRQGYRNPYTTPAPNILGIQQYIQQGFDQGQQERLRELEIQRLEQQLQSGGGG